MFELTLVKESLFLNFLEAMLDLVDVVNLDCSNMGVKLHARDTDRITIMELFIPTEDFGGKYHCDEDLSVGIPIDDMVKAIRCADQDDTITIKAGDEIFDTITLSFESPKNKTTATKTTATVKLRVVDANAHLFDIPDPEVLDTYYQATVNMPSAEFRRVCKYLSNIDGNGHISLTEKKLLFCAFGGNGQFYIKYMQSDKATTTTNVTYNMQAPVSFTMDLKYMYPISEAAALLDKVKICLSTMPMYPLMVECKGCKMGKTGYMRYFLAPKVSEEEMSDEEKEGSEEEMSDGENEESAEIKGSGEDKGSKRGRKRIKIEEQK